MTCPEYLSRSFDLKLTCVSGFTVISHQSYFSSKIDINTVKKTCLAHKLFWVNVFHKPSWEEARISPADCRQRREQYWKRIYLTSSPPGYIQCTLLSLQHHLVFPLIRHERWHDFLCWIIWCLQETPRALCYVLKDTLILSVLHSPQSIC